jgi:hypothetical protein|tara:strand:+ start:1078 stop:1224 length:147 start_codon:yes stop_codon:yes gene_type:complete
MKIVEDYGKEKNESYEEAEGRNETVASKVKSVVVADGGGRVGGREKDG